MTRVCSTLCHITVCYSVSLIPRHGEHLGMRLLQCLYSDTCPWYSWQILSLCNVRVDHTLAFLQVTKSFPSWKQVHVGMEASKTNHQTRWEWHHKTFTPSLYLAMILHYAILSVAWRRLPGREICSNPMCYVAEPLSDKIFLTRKFPDLQNLCSVKKIEAFS